MTPGIWQIAIVVILVLLIFGAGRLPRIMEDLAKGIKSFKKGMNDANVPEEPKAIEQEKSTNTAQKETEKE